MGGDGGCRVGEGRAGTTSPIPDHNGFNLLGLSYPKMRYYVRYPRTCSEKFSALRVNDRSFLSVDAGVMKDRLITSTANY